MMRFPSSLFPPTMLLGPAKQGQPCSNSASSVMICAASHRSNDTMISPPPKQSSEGPTRAEARFIHAFGYHLAKKMLGERQTNECILKAACQQHQHREDPSGGSDADAFRCFRANWRSNTRFPWHLPAPSGGERMEPTIGSEEYSKLDPLEALFVDVTFDFIVFPVEIADEGRANSCYVLEKEAFWQECTTGDHRGGATTCKANSVAMCVAIRIGALVAIPTTSHVTDASIGCNNAGSGGGKSMDGYQYKYQRGNNALTASDLNEHCISIDIVLEDMDPADVARIVGDAFLEGCAGGSSWQVMSKHDNSRAVVRCNSSNSNDNRIASMPGCTTHDLQLYLKLHHGSLQADGFLPLSSDGGDTSVESIGRCMLDMILMQSNRGIAGDVYTSVPVTEALLVWKSTDPSIVRAVEQPVEPSPRKLSPARSATALVNNVSENPAPCEGKDVQSQIVGKPTSTVRRPPKSQETALFARGKATTIGGSRKKPKFRLGPK